MSPLVEQWTVFAFRREGEIARGDFVIQPDSLGYMMGSQGRSTVFGLLLGRPGDRVYIGERRLIVCEGDDRCVEATRLCDFVGGFAQEDYVTPSGNGVRVDLKSDEYLVMTRLEYDDPGQIKFNFRRSDRVYPVTLIFNHGILREPARSAAELCGS